MYHYNSLLNVTLYIFRMPGSTYRLYIFPYGRFYLPSHCLEPTALDQRESARTLFILPLALSLFLPNGGVTLTLGVRVVKPLSSSPARSRMMRGSLLRGAVMTSRPPQIGLARPHRVPQMRCSFHKDSEQAIGQLQRLHQVLGEHQGVYYVLQN
jgi:hypothetical protein